MSTAAARFPFNLAQNDTLSPLTKDPKSVSETPDFSRLEISPDYCPTPPELVVDYNALTLALGKHHGYDITKVTTRHFQENVFLLQYKPRIKHHVTVIPISYDTIDYDNAQQFDIAPNNTIRRIWELESGMYLLLKKPIFHPTEVSYIVRLSHIGDTAGGLPCLLSYFTSLGDAKLMKHGEYYWASFRDCSLRLSCDFDSVHSDNLTSTTQDTLNLRQVSTSFELYEPLYSDSSVPMLDSDSDPDEPTSVNS